MKSRVPSPPPPMTVPRPPTIIYPTKRALLGRWIAFGLRLLAERLDPPLSVITPPRDTSPSQLEELRRRMSGTSR